LERAWIEGQPAPPIRTILEKAREEMHITDDEHKALEAGVKNQRLHCGD